MFQSAVFPKWPRLRAESELITNQVKPADGPHLKEQSEEEEQSEDEEKIEDDDMFLPAFWLEEEQPTRDNARVGSTTSKEHTFIQRTESHERGKEEEDKVLSSSMVKKKMESRRVMGLTPVAPPPKYMQAAEYTPKHNARAGTPIKHTLTTQPAVSGSNQRRGNAKSTIGASSLKDIQGYHPAIFDPVILEIEQQNWLHHEMDHRGCTIYKVPDIMLLGEEDNNVFLPTYLLVSARDPKVPDHIFDGMRPGTRTED
ncbi:hypothetical protein H6P81_017480 [Aristolochia fimbriata]|uniref:Uncharacterized protein n=1 Tax=Aristolochia fimbriata TaxID=158543 RepID=A0AAV7E164_ARIFI|nr:hypothetical protein H6P81_017480 [Aristolochia fimbriata]